MTAPWEVVVVSSDLESRRNLSAILTRQGIDPICTSTLHECREILSQKNVGIVFCDSHLSDGTYKEFLGAYRSREERPRVIVTSRHSEWDEFKEAIRFGAFDVNDSREYTFLHTSMKVTDAAADTNAPL